MNNFEIVVFIMTILIVLSVFTDKIKLPYPILLVAVGLVIGFVPFLPNLALDPDIVFLVFLPPILFDAAFKTSWLDFKKAIVPISTLAVTLVFFTTISVGIAAHYFIPGFSWPLAFVLGAIVSPPDAVAVRRGERLFHARSGCYLGLLSRAGLFDILVGCNLQSSLLATERAPRERSPTVCIVRPAGRFLDVPGLRAGWSAVSYGVGGHGGVSLFRRDHGRSSA